MKLTHLLLAVFLVFTGSQISYAKGNTKNDLKKEKLKGKVSLVTERAYIIKGGKDELLVKTVKNVNKKGNVDANTFYAPDGRVTRQIRSIYDDNGLLMEDVDSTVKGPVNVIFYKSDKNGNTTNMATFSTGAKFSAGVQMMYDNENNMVEKIEIDENNAIKFINTYTYDNKGNNTEIRMNAGDSVLKERQVYKYDKKGKTVELSTYDANSKLKNRYTFSYEGLDKKRNWLQFTRFEGDKAQLRVVREIEYYQ